MEIGASLRVMAMMSGVDRVGFWSPMHRGVLLDFAHECRVPRSRWPRPLCRSASQVGAESQNRQPGDTAMFSQKKVALSAVIVLSTGFTACAGDAGHSGTCTAQIAQRGQQIRGSGPTAPQSIEAQLHHQPTPRTVQNAESKAIADANAALQHAQQTNASCKESDRARSDSVSLRWPLQAGGSPVHIERQPIDLEERL